MSGAGDDVDTLEREVRVAGSGMGWIDQGCVDQLTTDERRRWNRLMRHAGRAAIRRRVREFVGAPTRLGGWAAGSISGEMLWGSGPMMWCSGRSSTLDLTGAWELRRTVRGLCS